MNKNHRILTLSLVVAIALFSLVGNGCKHLPTMPDEPFEPIDTTNMGVDTSDNNPDTTVVGEPCDPDKIYFTQDILPLLISNCTSSGCHNATDAANDVILVNYQQTIETADVRPFDLPGSDLYEVITEDDPDKVMPPPPRSRLTNAQVGLISEWILQGAEDLMCDPDTMNCDTVNVSYVDQVEPIIVANCRACHSGLNPGGGIDLGDYSGVRSVALNGLLYGVTERLDGFQAMPQNGPKLPQCEVDQIKSWIDAGAPNN